MTPKARSEGLLTHVVDDECVVYDKAQKVAHRLNATTAAVWKQLDGTRSLEEISEELGIGLGYPGMPHVFYDRPAPAGRRDEVFGEIEVEEDRLCEWRHPPRVHCDWNPRQSDGLLELCNKWSANPVPSSKKHLM